MYLDELCELMKGTGRTRLIKATAYKGALQ